MPEKPSQMMDNDLVHPSIEKQLTDSDAATALASGNNDTFLRWLTQQQFEAAKRPGSTAESDLQVRMALVYANAARFVGPQEQKTLKRQALEVLTNVNASITNELIERDRDFGEALQQPGRQERIKELKGLIQRIIQLRTEIMR
jgi:hypothetical protein